MMATIYAVYANELDRNRLIGFAIGNPVDIEAYFDDKKAYGLTLETVKPITVPEGFASKKAILIKQRDLLEAEINRLNREIGKL